jgi:dTDP-4-amino-4,6-dideoxygalactose transaminase
MDAIQGAVLGVKLPFLDGWNAARRRVANLYNDGLSEALLGLPAGPFGADHACHVYAVCAGDRARLRAALNKAGIATNIHYPVPVHLQPAYAGLGHKAGDFPASEALARETLSLPLFPELPDRSVAAVIDILSEATARRLARMA